MKTRDASHCDLAIYIKKYLKAKEELYMEIQIFNSQFLIFFRIAYVCH
jgi:hypothetical protein